MADDNTLNLRYYMNGTVDTLKLNDQTLTDEQLEFITTNLPSNCRKLIFSHTELTDIGIQYIAENLLLRGGVGSKLTYLALRNTSITDDGVITLCNALIAGNNKIRSLSLDINNNITSIGAKALAKMLEVNNQKGCLEVLDISYTMIGRDAVYAICKSLENNTKLKLLDLTATLTIDEINEQEMSELLEKISTKLSLLLYC